MLAVWTIIEMRCFHPAKNEASDIFSILQAVPKRRRCEAFYFFESEGFGRTEWLDRCEIVVIVCPRRER
jgi:hypothetical protein